MAGEACKSRSKSHIVLMFPWLAMGHITPYLHLSNKLAERGYKISFLLPNKAKLIIEPLNLHPSLINFHTLSIPHVDGLPLGTETMADVSFHFTPLLSTALDLTRPQVEHIILKLNPGFVFYDSAHWIPEITSKLGIKSVAYHIVSAASLAIALVPLCAEIFLSDDPPTDEELAVPPVGYPSSVVVLRKHEARSLRFISEGCGIGITFFERINTSLKSGDVIAIRTCRELEGKFCDYLSNQFNKPVLLTGPVLPDSITEHPLEERWASWLVGHKPGTVVYCSFGSETVLKKEQFQEILLGLELAGYPFFVRLKPPSGCSKIEEAFPEGFDERVRGKGVVHGGWVQQPLLLKHPSIGCFISHSGFGSTWESLLSSPQIVLVPQFGEQILNARIMAGELKVAVEVDKDETGWVSKESLSMAVKEVMDEESNIGSLIRKNHAIWKDRLDNHGFMTEYVDTFVQQLSEITTPTV